MTALRRACRSCQAPVIWTLTAASGLKKSMPVDAEPVDGGNLVLTDRGAFMESHVESILDDPGGPRHVSHFVTCPDEAHWRKAK